MKPGFSRCVAAITTPLSCFGIKKDTNLNQWLMSYLQFIILFMPDNRVLSAICIFLQCKDHIRIPLKKAGTFLPAYPTFAVLQTDKLLFHFSSAVWAYLITFSHKQTTPLCTTRILIFLASIYSYIFPIYNIFANVL